ncbi:sensor histidine kinase [Brevundimonas sp. 2R-24]|uniref:histidine kinase n=1 Tax=Peiella sedimenti TaxID=3061083 RepID=A0ABT8SKE8_9CAUL|nr:sensor histidine kinase [Caulobacteraceae bacterium XZ-24]
MRALRSRLRMPRFEGIRFRMGVALALAMAPLLLLSIVQSQAAFRREAHDRRADLTTAARLSAATAQARIESASVLLETLQPDTVGLNCVPRLRALRERLEGYETLARFSATGRVTCAASSLEVVRAVTGDGWFERLRAGEPMVVRPSGLSLSAGPGVLVAQRVEQPRGRFNGAVVAVLSADALAPRPYRGHGDLGPAEVALVDDGGRMLATTNIEAFAGAPAGWTARAAAEGSVVMVERDASGERVVLAGAPIGSTRTFVLLSQPDPGWLNWARLNALVVLFLPLLAWVLALGATLVVSERLIIRWLAYLERVAGIYAKGKFNVRPVQARYAPAEIRTLAWTLDQMGDAIESRDHRLRDSLEEKDALMREIHHRVKNNLQVISSLLNMQQRALTDPAARSAVNDTRQRISALALIYRALYQSEELRHVDVRQFLEDLTAQMIATEQTRGAVVRTELSADTLVIDPDKLAPLALWTVEAISNAQKHAFAGRGGSLWVTFRVMGEESVLTVRDDGPGADPEAVGQGVGRTLMTAFARQLRGATEIEQLPEGGTLTTLRFPTPEAAGTRP